MSNKVYIFKRFVRFWHWSQALLIITLLITGFEVHGLYSVFGFESAVSYHAFTAWTLVGLWIFAIFWHVTTGEWRQYVPTLENIDAMIKFYSIGIFKNEPHPHRPTIKQKHNPLQRLAYLFVLTVIGPTIWVSGWLYLFYDVWPEFGLANLSLEWVAITHASAAYLMLIFLIAHLYLITTGHTPTGQIKAMITGWDEVENEDNLNEQKGVGE